MDVFKSKLSEKYIWVILVLFTIPTFIAIIRPGYFSMHDDIQAFRIHQLDKCIKDFQIPCRWVPDMGYQYGYPQFNYYPPSIYYLGEFIHLLGFQFIDTIKVIIALGYIFSALGMYLLLKDWLGKFPAFVGMMLYTLAPYKSVDSYVRGALSEFWALVFFPLIFWSSLKLIKEQKPKYIAYLALSLGLLLTTHNLMSFIFMPILAVWVITWVILENKWQMLPKLIVAGFWGLGLAAFFTFPVLLEKEYVHLDSIISGYFDYRLHFADLYELFVSNYWGYGSSVWGPKDELSLTTGHIQWIVAVLGGFLAVINFKKYKKLSFITFVLLFLAVFSLFMTHYKSSFIWEQFAPVFAYIQFPWRFLANSIFLLPIVGGITIYFISKQSLKLANFFGVMIVAGLFILYGSFFTPHSWSDISDKEKFSGILWEKQLTISIFDYLPIYATLPPPSKAPEYPEVMDGEAKFLNYSKRSHFQSGEVEILSEKANLRLPIFDFPGMRVLVDGNLVTHWHDDCRNQKYCMGLLSIDVLKGKHSLKVELTDTLVRKVSNFISILSILGLIIFFINKKRKIFQ